MCWGVRCTRSDTCQSLKGTLRGLPSGPCSWSNRPEHHQMPSKQHAPSVSAARSANKTALLMCLPTDTGHCEGLEGSLGTTSAPRGDYNELTTIGPGETRIVEICNLPGGWAAPIASSSRTPDAPEGRSQQTKKLDHELHPAIYEFL